MMEKGRSNISEIKAIETGCGPVHEAVMERDFSFQHAVIRKPTEPHLHKSMDEVYYVIKGRGKARIGGEEMEIGAGDFVKIPRGMCHEIFQIDEPMEIVFMTHPGFNAGDIHGCIDASSGFK